MSETPEEQSNPYAITLVVIAGAATFFGLIMMLGTEPGYDGAISPVQLAGSVIFVAGLLSGVAWLAVSAMLWRPKVKQKTEDSIAS
ncbi:hypothetical protein [Amycolatopsis palatopharyngis]|uniref:hypothetical protein n=1 Tax=Amycolatopsis palatopharyngis TaxID=187982 RepID=UPI000E22F045|nr:hypothetical protein [Amycolatopsis palatopharyngis]